MRFPPPPAEADGYWYALEILRRSVPKDWPAWLLDVPAAQREVAERFLREEADLMRARRRAAR